MKSLEFKPHTTETKKRKSSSKNPPESKQVRLDNFGVAIEKNYATLKTYSQPVLQKWHDRTNVASISKTKQLSTTNLLKNIEDSLINKPELIKKTQIYRGGYDVFDMKNNLSLFTSDDKAVNVEDIEGDQLLESVNKLVCPEIFDDSDFYHQLLRELIQSKSGDNQGQLEITKKYHELQKLRRKMKKTVDTRASKGRKIRYKKN
jgi:protein AATF/BFR2